MQLDKKKSFSKAASSLLGVTLGLSGVAQAAQWEHTLGLSHYNEADGRVDDNAVRLQSTRTTEDEQTLSLNLGIDSLTGASPSGRVAADGSGGLRLTSIEDTRSSGAVSYSRRLTESYNSSIGLTVSDENDYNHLGVNVSLSKELDQKNTVLSIGLAQSSDSISAVGGNKTAGASTSSASLIGEQDKDVTDVVFGLTQVLSKNSIAQINYSYSQNSGYLNDPYKVVSIIDSDGKPVDFVHEKRPDDRTGNSLYMALNTKTNTGTFKPSFRYYTDDFGIDSQTLEFRFAKQLANDREIEPYLRLYHQTNADFYRAQMPRTEATPAYFSSDYRLSEFNSYTLGFHYRWKGGNDVKYSIGASYYYQDPATPEDQLAGQSDLNPGVKAFLLRFNITF